jgi:hypothetical protein
MKHDMFGNELGRILFSAMWLIESSEIENTDFSEGQANITSYHWFYICLPDILYCSGRDK